MTVAKPKVVKIWVVTPNITLNAHERYTISYASNPTNIPDYYNAVWRSGNEAVVQVEDTYYECADIYAAGAGETDITLTVGGKTVQCHVVVK